jgi:hypothetical protein
VDAKQAATFTNTIARIYLDHTNEFTLPSGFSKDPSDPFYSVDPNTEHIDYTRIFLKRNKSSWLKAGCVKNQNVKKMIVN